MTTRCTWTDYEIAAVLSAKVAMPPADPRRAKLTSCAAVLSLQCCLPERHRRKNRKALKDLALAFVREQRGR